MQVEDNSNRRLGLAFLWKLNTASTCRSPAPSQQPPRVSCHVQQPDRIEALFFGYLLLGQQKKVTRLPAETGGLLQAGGLPPRHSALTQ